jgi:methylamine dehydrogenase light chain
MKIIDRWTEKGTRAVAQRSSRRSFLARLGTLVVGGAATVPLLPVARGQNVADNGARRAPAPSENAGAGPWADETKCEYWRNCGMDGFMCGCCGGSTTTCPPGTEMAPLTWIGTCHHPGDGKDYIISYHDCCGKSTCGRCMCSRQDGVLPNYVPAKANDINWCQGATTNVYHCTTTILLGLAVAEG